MPAQCARHYDGDSGEWESNDEGDAKTKFWQLLLDCWGGDPVVDQLNGNNGEWTNGDDMASMWNRARLWCRNLWEAQREDEWVAWYDRMQLRFVMFLLWAVPALLYLRHEYFVVVGRQLRGIFQRMVFLIFALARFGLRVTAAVSTRIVVLGYNHTQERWDNPTTSAVLVTTAVVVLLVGVLWRWGRWILLWTTLLLIDIYLKTGTVVWCILGLFSLLVLTLHVFINIITTMCVLFVYLFCVVVFWCLLVVVVAVAVYRLTKWLIGYILPPRPQNLHEVRVALNGNNGEATNGDDLDSRAKKEAKNKLHRKFDQEKKKVAFGPKQEDLEKHQEKEVKLCKFFNTPRGCKVKNCKFAHVVREKTKQELADEDRFECRVYFKIPGGFFVELFYFFVWLVHYLYGWVGRDEIIDRLTYWQANAAFMANDLTTVIAVKPLLYVPLLSRLNINEHLRYTHYADLQTSVKIYNYLRDQCGSMSNSDKVMHTLHFNCSMFTANYPDDIIINTITRFKNVLEYNEMRYKFHVYSKDMLPLHKGSVWKNVKGWLNWLDDT